MQHGDLAAATLVLDARDNVFPLQDGQDSTAFRLVIPSDSQPRTARSLMETALQQGPPHPDIVRHPKHQPGLHSKVDASAGFESHVVIHSGIVVTSI